MGSRTKYEIFSEYNTALYIDVNRRKTPPVDRKVNILQQYSTGNII